MKKSKKAKLRLSKKMNLSLKTLKEFSKKHGAVVVGAIIALALCAAGIALAVKAPELKDSWIRHKVGPKSYRLVEPEVGMGTGFAVKAPSGKSYILTNDHVCDAAKDQLHLLVEDDNGEKIPRTILHRSDKTDLCLLEGMPGVEGLNVSSSRPQAGDTMTAVGHPSGYLTTLTKGELIMSQDLEIPIGAISVKIGETEEQLIPEEMGGMDEKECSKPKNKVLVVKDNFLGMTIVTKYCMTVTKGAYFTTILAQPGSSGSPVVNQMGEVVAVLFAGDRFGWSMLVSFDDLQDFLKKY